ncbi:winged helix-turn-helix domain-containing protein [Actinokineospora pegani]|uniref:winged helix-turn-helix domain-containing protein n=1 Tax=Actinokineospora pegani TaxID=2654637 RepID=UPI0018D38D49|nr:winged helix-turn-helix domain-containing protein [Actinokineospora pegani]
MDSRNVLERLDMPLVLCVGTTPEEVAAVTTATGGRAAVLYVPDQRALRTALGPAPKPVVTVHHVVEHAGLRLDPTTRTAACHGAELALSAREFDLLLALAANPGQVWTFADLTTHVWDRPYVGDAQAVVSAIKRLRRQLRATGSTTTVDSVRGVGYRLTL